MALLESLSSLTATAWRDEASQLRKIRERAWASVYARGLPTVRDEAWRYTDLSAVHGRVFGAPPLSEPHDVGITSLPLDVPDAARVVFVNGHYRPTLSDVRGLEADVVLKTLGDLRRDDPGALVTLLGKSDRDDSSFGALNTAFVQDGLVVEVAPHRSCATTLHVVFISTSSSQAFMQVPRLLVRANEHSAIDIVETHCGLPGAQQLTNAWCEIKAQSGARVRHARLQCETKQAHHIGNLTITAYRDSDVRSVSCMFGGALARLDISATLVAPGSTVRLDGLFVAQDGQHLDHHTRIDHAASNTHSTEIYKGIADGNGRGVFRGKINVQQDAQKITARQMSNNLLLSALAEIDTKPELEIYADDVSCAHGATVGQLDDAALFYLRSRGVEEATARGLLTFGFAQAVIEPLPWAEVRQWVARQVAGSAGLVSEDLHYEIAA